MAVLLLVLEQLKGVVLPDVTPRQNSRLPKAEKLEPEQVQPAKLHPQPFEQDKIGRKHHEGQLHRHQPEAAPRVPNLQESSQACTWKECRRA